MQPYFMPYIGYWQLINAVDTFVIYDDVNYIKNGWINRNQILLNGDKHYLTIPLFHASPNKLINTIEIHNDLKKIDKLLRKIEACYRKAPFFNVIFPIVSSILRFKCKFIIDILIYQFNVIKDFLDIHTNFVLSSRMDDDKALRSHARVINICKLLNATTYINAPGGKELYSQKLFQENGLKLYFIKTQPILYRQYGDSFVSDLSLIDILMFCDPQEIRDYLNGYELQ